MNSQGRDSVFEGGSLIRKRKEKSDGSMNRSWKHLDDPINRIWKNREKSKNRSWKNPENRNEIQSGVSFDSQSDADDLDDMAVVVEDEVKLKMRRNVFVKILESEVAYLAILDILMKHMTTYKNIASTPQMVIPLADINVIFFKISELYHAHQMLVHQLKPLLGADAADRAGADDDLKGGGDDDVRKEGGDVDDVEFAPIFYQLATAEKSIAPFFLSNYPIAVSTLHRCWEEYPQFSALTKIDMLKTSKEASSLEDLLYNPVLRFQRNAFFLQDLIKFTPVHLSDYDLFHKTLQLCKSSFENNNSEEVDTQRYLAIQGLIVEKVGSLRKLRHIFLFNDLLLCARQKLSSSVKHKIHLELKWHIPLSDLSIHDLNSSIEEERLKESQSEELDVIQKKLLSLKKELKCEMALLRKEQEDPQRQWSFNLRSKNQNIEKTKKRILEQQVKLIKTSPHLIFKLHNRKLNKQQTLLMASDFERNKWRSTIAALLSRAKTAVSFSNSELQNLANSQHISISKSLGGLVSFIDYNLLDEHLFGNLNIHIFQLHGDNKPAHEHYCTVEVDTFGQFLMKAKTKVVGGNTESVWNEEFDIELEGTQTLRIHCYCVVVKEVVLLGTFAMELSKTWLRGDFIEKSISISDELSLTISLVYSSRQKTLHRAGRAGKGGLFGGCLKSTAKRENSDVPLIVMACVREVQKRGMAELGIYRVSGGAGDINKLKKAFEKNTKAACSLLEDAADIHVVTGLLKAYLRELPEALFTDLAYPKLIKALGLASSEAKEAMMTSIIESLPLPNKLTIDVLLLHLIKVAQHEDSNRMNLHNLSTIFAPTLLRPGKQTNSEAQSLEEIFSSCTKEVMLQTQVLSLLFKVKST